MRRQVQARDQGDGTRASALPVLFLVLFVCCAVSLAGCGASLSTEFTALDPPVAEQPSGLSDAKPLSQVADKLTSAGTPGTTGYKIGPLDVVEFSVFKVPELMRTVQVSEMGSVNLPLVGEVEAAGKTAQDLERDLTRKLQAKYLQSPQVTILIKEYNSQRVTVEGAVKKPGVYPIRGRTTLLQVIATAQGLDTASDTTVVVFRQAAGKRMAARFDIGQIRSGTTVDPPIQSGDVVVAPTSSTRAAFDTILKSLPIATVFALL